MADIAVPVFKANNTVGVDFTTGALAVAADTAVYVADDAPTMLLLGVIAGALANISQPHVIPNNGNVRLYLESTPGGLATVVTPGEVDGNEIADRLLVMLPGKLIGFGPFGRTIYGDPLRVTFSADVFLLAIRG